MIRTRFAPSPTGYLHVGGLRTALYSYLLAKQQGGQFLLRIEDTDRERYVADGTLNILKSLYWAGIIPDEGVQLDEMSVPGESSSIQSGDCGAYIQSERLEIYQEYIRVLLDKSHAYYCFCTTERLDAMRERQQSLKLPTLYDGLCAKISVEEASKRVAAGERHVVRMRMPKEGQTTFDDLIRGAINFENRLIDDQVLIKSDGFPTYHFAVVVDDHLMKITHVVRGEEWISSTPKHLQLYNYFGWEAPQFAHLPLLLNPDKSKLSKRQGDVAVGDYISKGYLPEALLNFVAFLGWNPGDEREIFSLEELVREFKLEKVNKAGGVFNLEKLDWYNKEYIKRLTGEELVKKSRPFFEKESSILNPQSSTDNKWFEKVLSLEKERVTTLAELPTAVAFIFKLPEYDGSLLIWKKSTREEARQILPALQIFLTGISENEWAKTALEMKVGEWITQNSFPNGAVLAPLRVALSGQQNSPGPFEIAEVLGKAVSIERITIAVGKL
jgi:nondiscriminating glutamyl-tRNA synthetase